MTLARLPFGLKPVEPLIGAVATTAVAALVLTAQATAETIAVHPIRFGTLFVLSLVLGVLSVEIYDRGSVSVAGIGLLAVGFTLGPGPAMAVGIAIAAVHLMRMRLQPSRGIFNAGTMVLAPGSAVVAYQLLQDRGWHPVFDLMCALAAGVIFWAVNVGLVTIAMSLAEGMSVRDVWRERFRWLTLHYIAFGPLALASTVAYEQVGVVGLLAFIVPPALLILSVRQYIARTEEYVERLRDANTELGEQNERIRKVHLDTIAALSRSMEAKDTYTGNHTERVSAVAVALARRLGYEGEELDAVEIGALLHDIGKIGIPERILNKPGPLDPDEWIVMKRHPVVSEYILSGIEVSPIVRQIARSSHERMDGAGYPDRLRGDEIPLPARIVLVADAFDALTSDRPYRRARDLETALREIRRNAGSQFCPSVVAALDEVAAEEPDILGIDASSATPILQVA